MNKAATAPDIFTALIAMLYAQGLITTNEFKQVTKKHKTSGGD